MQYNKGGEFNDSAIPWLLSTGIIGVRSTMFIFALSNFILAYGYLFWLLAIYGSWLFMALGSFIFAISNMNADVLTYLILFFSAICESYASHH